MCVQSITLCYIITINSTVKHRHVMTYMNAPFIHLVRDILHQMESYLHCFGCKKCAFLVLFARPVKNRFSIQCLFDMTRDQSLLDVYPHAAEMMQEYNHCIVASVQDIIPTVDCEGDEEAINFQRNILSASSCGDYMALLKVYQNKSQQPELQTPAVSFLSELLHDMLELSTRRLTDRELTDTNSCNSSVYEVLSTRTDVTEES